MNWQHTPEPFIGLVIFTVVVGLGFLFVWRAERNKQRQRDLMRAARASQRRSHTGLEKHARTLRGIVAVRQGTQTASTAAGKGEPCT